jgi:proteasome lid subunit RPN8/RPN11
MGRVRFLDAPRSDPPANGKGPLPCPPFGAGLLSPRHRAENESPAPGDCDVLVLQSAYRKVVAHLAADTSREHGGLLLGVEMPAPGGGTSVLILHALPGKFTQGTPVSLTFTHETWKEFDRLVEAYDSTDFRLRRVGWYHSHPDIAIFLSGYDLDVCKDFDRPTDWPWWSTRFRTAAGCSCGGRTATAAGRRRASSSCATSSRTPW